MQKPQSFGQVAIIGLGLIGGSLGLAIRRKKLARTVVGFSRTPATIKRAKALGAIDIAASNLEDAVREADLVVLAAPVSRIVPLAKQAAQSMRPDAILTDVASTKASIARNLDKILRESVRFVGAHPVAGSEQSGIEAASAGLFDSGYCILTPARHTDPAALRQVEAFWKALTPLVLVMSPELHDRRLAVMSHLPHLIAFALASIAPKGFPPPKSFQEMTRIAKSDPELWTDIFANNRKALLDAFDHFDAAVRQMAILLRDNRFSALRRELARSKAVREALDRSS